MAGDGEMVGDARALVRQAMAVGSRRTRQLLLLCCFSVRTECSINCMITSA